MVHLLMRSQIQYVWSNQALTMNIKHQGNGPLESAAWKSSLQKITFAASEQQWIMSSVKDTGKLLMSYQQ